MIKFGCLARYFNRYENEVEFARSNGFEFMQLWYDNKGLLFKDISSQVKVIKEYDYPTIIHAVLDINEFEKQVPILLDVVKALKHRELIIHPICQSEVIETKTIQK